MWFATFISVDCVSVYVGVWLRENWGLSHLTKMMPIVCRVMIGEHLDLLRTLFCCRSCVSEPDTFLLHCSPSVIHVKKKRVVVWEFPLFSPHLKSKLLHCGSRLYDHCEPSGSNGQSHRNWATRAVSAWRAHQPQGTFYHQEVVGKRRYFCLFSLLQTNTFTKQTIRRHPCQVTSLKGGGKLGQLYTGPQ